jgi:uncharacterized alkaline shock family protein YloU
MNTPKNANKAAAQASAETARPPMPPMPEVNSDDDGPGKIQISEHVISSVVRKYALEVPGVCRFASSLVGGLAEMIGRKSTESNVVVTLEGEMVRITLNLVLEFGVRVPEVAGLVQEVVSSKVEELTGKHVSKVDVIVQDLEEPEADKKQTDEVDQ